MGHITRKEPGPAEVLADGQGNTEWGVEKDHSEYQLRPCDQPGEQGLRLYYFSPDVILVYCNVDMLNNGS